MKVILKYLFRNMAEKKFRSLIAVLTIAISAALFFASSSVSDTVVKMFTDNMKRYSGSADIVIRPNEDSPKRLFKPQTETYQSRADYQFGALEGLAQYAGKEDENTLFKTLGIAYDDLQEMNPFRLADQQDLTPFSGDKVIISSKSAQKLGKQVGDSLQLTINDREETFKIVGVSEPTGMFKEFGTDSFAVMPKSTADTLAKADGDVNVMFVKAKDPLDKQALIDDLATLYQDYSVDEAVSLDDINEQIGGISSIFMVLTLIISLLSIFIIYSSFKVITVERIHIMGVFRSVGATKRMTGMIMLGESLLYGVVGGLLGCGIGIGLLYLMSLIANKTIVQGAEMTIDFTPDKLVISFLIALILCLVSAFLPIFKASRIPLKEIVLGKFETFKTGGDKAWVQVLKLLPLAVSVVLPLVASADNVLVIDLVALILLVAGLIVAVPVLTPLIVFLLKGLYKGLFGNEGFLALKNVTFNKNILNNISLLSVAISILLMTNTVINGIVLDLSDFYSNTVQYDMRLEAKQLAPSSVMTAKGVKGVKDAYGSYSVFDTKVDGTNVSIGMVEGADPSKYLNYWNVKIDGDRAALVNQLAEDRNIILSDNYREKLNVAAGDTITLNMQDKRVNYKVIGFMSTRIADSHYAVVAPEFLKEDMNLTNFNALYVKIDSLEHKDIDAANKALRVAFKDQTPLVASMYQVAASDLDNNAKLFIILRIFLVLAVMVGVLSVTNNLLIGFMERKRSLAVLRSIGMSKVQVVKMIFIEALTSGLIGSALGLAGGLVMVWIMPRIVDAVNQHIAIHYSISLFAVSFIAGVLVTLLASVSFSLKSSRIDIVQTIRME